MKKLETVLAYIFTISLGVAAQTPPDTVKMRLGYANELGLSVAGAVDLIDQDRMQKRFSTSTLDALNGQAAGVQVSTNSEAMLSSVRVRGTTSLTGGNDPLVIIDGVQSDITALSTIYPSDIENFTILKDASETAQYGSRGATGVIQVNTKKGRSGRFHIAFDGHIGLEGVTKNLHMLSAAQFRQAADALGVSIVDKGYDTDFTQSPTRTGRVFINHIAFGGGSETANYRASLGVIDHNTIIRDNSYRNYTAKLDVHQLAFDNRMTIDLGIFGSLQKNEYIPFMQKLFYSAATFNPTFPDGRNEAGDYDGIPEATWISNPNALLESKDDDNNSHVNAHLRAKLYIGSGLTLSAFGSFSYSNIQSGHYYPSFIANHGEAYRRSSKSEERMGNVSLNWAGDVANGHHVELLALAEAESSIAKGFYTTVSGFSTNSYGYDNLSAGAELPWGGTNSIYTEAHMESFLMRGQYSYKNRYTLNVTARADGSSKVGRNHRWGFFPSIGGVWLVSDEPWLKQMKWVSKLKLRIGYGRSGNLGGIDPYYSQQLVQPNGIVPVGGTTVTTLGIIRNANPDLRWEIKRTFNAGIDMALWKNRIVMTFDFYASRTSDMLYQYDVPVPPFTYPTLLANLGKMRNHGFEIGFGITPLRQKDMELNINTKWSFERNKLISLNGEYQGQHLTAPDTKAIATLYGAGYHGGNDVVFQIVGQPLGVFFLPHFLGFETTENGAKRYKVTSERYICGQATPKATMGTNIAYRYKQWDITMQMNGAFGHKIYNGTSLTYMNMLNLPNYNVMEDAPAMNIQDQDISDYWLENGDYVNIDYITLGWNVPLHSRHINHLRLSCSVNNVATITGYSGLTPMINSSAVNSTLGVDDKRSMPVYRTYSIGISAQF